MTGVQITADFRDLKQARKTLERLGDLDRAALMDDVAGHLEARTSERFEKEQAPGGKPWQPTRRGGAILRDTGRLAASITSSASASQARIGSNVIYAGIHQAGGTIRPVNAKALAIPLPGGGIALAQEVTIPARPFLGIDGEDEAAIEDIVGEHIDRVLRGHS